MINKIISAARTILTNRNIIGRMTWKPIGWFLLFSTITLAIGISIVININKITIKVHNNYYYIVSEEELKESRAKWNGEQSGLFTPVRIPKY